MKKRIIRIFLYLFFIIFLITFLFAPCKLNFILVIIPLIIVILFSKIPDKYFPFLLFSLALILRITMIFILNVPLEDDFKTMYNAALFLNKGDFSLIKGTYFINFSYQIGYTLFLSLLLKICNSIIFVKIINSLITSFIVLFIYKIARIISSEKASKIVSLLYLLFFYPLYLNNILTNQHIHLFIILIIIYLFLSKKLIKYKWYYQIGIFAFLLALSNVFRSEAIIYILSILMIVFIIINKNNYKEILKKISLFILIYFSLFSIFSFTTKLLGYSNTGLKNNTPLWKFYVGLSYKNNGMYNVNDQNIFFKNNSKIYQEKIFIKRIKQDYLKFPVLFLKKEVILWTNTNWNINLKNKFINTFLYKLLLDISSSILILILALFLIGIVPNKKIDNKVIYIQIILFVYYLVYLFIETSPRYGYNVQTILFIMASLGIDRVINYIKKVKLI